MRRGKSSSVPRSARPGAELVERETLTKETWTHLAPVRSVNHSTLPASGARRVTNRRWRFRLMRNSRRVRRLLVPLVDRRLRRVYQRQRIPCPRPTSAAGLRAGAVPVQRPPRVFAPSYTPTPSIRRCRLTVVTCPVLSVVSVAFRRLRLVDSTGRRADGQVRAAAADRPTSCADEPVCHAAAESVRWSSSWSGPRHSAGHPGLRQRTTPHGRPCRRRPACRGRASADLRLALLSGDEFYG